MEDQMALQEEREWKMSWRVFIQELKKVSYLAAPMVAVSVLQYLLQVASMMMVGQIGQLSLASVALATSVTNVTGFSLLYGLVGALDTLCGQSYGAEQYHKLSVYTYTAIISLALVCVPICVLWIFMDNLLILMGQDHAISTEARKYSMWIIPGLFGCAIQEPLTDLGNIGAAIAFSLSNWLFVALLVIYIRYSKPCKITRAPFSIDAFHVTGKFFRLAIPSAGMVCLKWWSLEVLVFLSGLLPNPELQTSLLSICLTISTLHFTVPYAFGAAASARVSNELGAGNAQKARVAVWAVMSLAVTETIIVGATLFGCRHVLGRAYSNDKHVVDYIAVMTPFICLSIVTDSLHAVISGIARESGWQHIGACVNFGAFYLVGIPLSVVLGYILHLKAKGLWIGILIGSVVQATILSLVTGFTDWQKQAAEDQKRII